MTTIYTCTHADFTPNGNLKGEYKIITDGTELNNTYQYPIIQADNELLPMKHCYSEGYMIYDIWKKDNESDYIGINHYRRFFDLQRYEEIQENVLPIPYAFDMYAQYGGCHNIQDLNECISIINKYYPEYNTNVLGLFPCNMAILEHNIFNEWCSFIFSVLEIFNERKHLYTDEDVRNYVSQYFPNNVDYQARLHGFLLERLSTIFFTNKFSGKPLRLSKIIQI